MNVTARSNGASNRLHPRCPITGTAPVREVQKIPAKLFQGLWKMGLGIDVTRSFRDASHVALYESECGLMYFHPTVEGDERFYREFYRRVGMYRHLNRGLAHRTEFREAARRVEPGMAVLDVGCGSGGFATHLPHAEYTGLDRFAPEDANPAILREDLSAHAARSAGRYDVVAAFQVIEHVADPCQFAAWMLQCLRPGGYLILGAPLHPSPMTCIPNFLLNAPPHHLTWWNPSAVAALAAVHGLEVIEARSLAPATHERLIHWMGRLSPVKTQSSRYFAHRYSWHLSLAWSLIAASLVARFRDLPGKAQPVNTLLVARKPMPGVRGASNERYR